MGKIVLIILGVVILLTACTPYRYGVPQETWDRMGEAERVEAIRVYERDQQARRQAAEDRARRAALERELASYSSTSDLNDLHAILDRYSDQETAQIRRILASQRGI